MAVIAKVAKLIGDVVTAVLGVQLATEFEAWTPWLVERLLRQAVARLPKGEQERFAEEWRAHVNEIPGQVGRVAVALAFVLAACKMSAFLTGGSGWVTLRDSAKRVFDVLMSAAELFATAPLLALVALTIRLQGNGPAIFQVERVGLGGRRFVMWRFRTIASRDYSGARAVRPGRRSAQARTDEFLRMTGLHLLPALVNILRGDMSVVGPRAHSAAEADEMSRLLPGYSKRTAVRPGLVGLAFARGSLGPVAELADDLYYVEHRSLWLDLQVLFLCIKNTWKR